MRFLITPLLLQAAASVLLFGPVCSAGHGLAPAGPRSSTTERPQHSTEVFKRCDTKLALLPTESNPEDGIRHSRLSHCGLPSAPTTPQHCSEEAHASPHTTPCSCLCALAHAAPSTKDAFPCTPGIISSFSYRWLLKCHHLREVFQKYPV